MYRSYSYILRISLANHITHLITANGLYHEGGRETTYVGGTVLDTTDSSSFYTGGEKSAM